MLHDLPKNVIIIINNFISRHDTINLILTCKTTRDILDAKIKKIKFFLKWRKWVTDRKLQNKLIIMKQECIESRKIVWIPEVQSELYLATKVILDHISLYSYTKKNIVYVPILMTSLNFIIICSREYVQYIIDIYNTKNNKHEIIENRILRSYDIRYCTQELIEILNKLKFNIQSNSISDWPISWVDALCLDDNKAFACKKAGFLQMGDGLWKYNPLSEEDVWIELVIPFQKIKNLVI